MERSFNDRLVQIEARLRGLAEAQSRSNDLIQALVDAAREPGDDRLVTILEKIQNELVDQTAMLKRVAPAAGDIAAARVRKPVG